MRRAVSRAPASVVAVPNAGAGRPGGLEHLAELAAVLGGVDRGRRRAEDRQAGVGEALRERQRRLAAERDDEALDRTGGELGVVDLEHVLERQRLEVQPVRGVVVRRDRLGVAVDHDGLELALERQRGVHARVVELDALADAVGARAEDEDRRAGARRDLGLLVVGRVVVRRAGGELGRARVDRLEHRAQADRVPGAADGVLGRAAQRGDLHVRQAVPLGVQQHVAGQRVGACGSSRRDLVDELDLVEEPRVDARELVDRLEGDAGAQHLLDVDEAVLGGPGDRRDERVEGVAGQGVAGPVEHRALLVDRPHGLAERLGEVAAQRHRLADRLHGRGQRVVGGRELLEREPRDLDDDVVERGLERRRRRAARDVVRDLVERVADRELGGDLGDREAGRLRGQRGATATRAGSSR